MAMWELYGQWVRHMGEELIRHSVLMDGSLAVAELVPHKSLQARAFSIMPLVWCVGSVFGPILGGALASPVEKYPALFGDSNFLKRFPFALPNLVSAVVFAGGVTVGVLFLKVRPSDLDQQQQSSAHIQ